MARRDKQWAPGFEEVNLLLFNAWEHGARHAVLRPDSNGTEIRFLGPDGTEHHESLSLSYAHLVARLRQMTARYPRMHLNMGGNRWHLQAAVPRSRSPDRVFLHMRPAED